MKNAPVPANEKARLAELYRYDILDTEAETEFDDLVKMASRICNVPISIISLLDSDRQWFKATVGTDDQQTARDISFCSHGILDGDLFMVPDTHKDERFADNPLVTGKQQIRFYAGVPLKTESGNNIGMMCVTDSVPRNLTDEQQQALKILGHQVVKQLELRLKNKELERIAAVQKRIISIMAHDVRSPLASLIGLFNLYDNKAIDPTRMHDFLQVAGSQLNGTLQLLENLVEWGQIQLETTPLEQSLTPLRNCVQQVFYGLTVQASQKNNKLVNGVPEMTRVPMDTHVLQFVLRNLLTNANKFTDQGTIVVDAITVGKTIQVRIIDTGIGMPSKMAERLFMSTEKHSRRGTQNESGSGLGLVLVKEFIEQANGRLMVESEEGKGSIFTLEFPAE